jgi:plasmid stability protein
MSNQELPSMSLYISFPIEIEFALRRRAAAAGKDVEAYVREIVVEEVAEEPSPPPNSISHAEFMTRLRETIQRHGIKHGKFDDSRDSIYAGRGE